MSLEVDPHFITISLPNLISGMYIMLNITPASLNGTKSTNTTVHDTPNVAHDMKL
jgi:hypothetical protein